jgi:hypothetical protein
MNVLSENNESEIEKKEVDGGGSNTFVGGESNTFVGGESNTFVGGESNTFVGGESNTFVGGEVPTSGHTATNGMFLFYWKIFFLFSSFLFVWLDYNYSVVFRTN